MISPDMEYLLPFSSVSVTVQTMNIFKWNLPYSPMGLPVWSSVEQYSISTIIFFVLSAQLLNSDSNWRQSIWWRGLWVIPSTRVRYFSGSEPIWLNRYLPAMGQSTGAGGFTTKYILLNLSAAMVSYNKVFFFQSWNVLFSRVSPQTCYPSACTIVSPNSSKMWWINVKTCFLLIIHL